MISVGGCGSVKQRLKRQIMNKLTQIKFEKGNRISFLLGTNLSNLSNLGDEDGNVSIFFFSPLN